MRLRASLLTVCVAIALALPALGADPAQARADYDRLQKWFFTVDPIAVAQPLTFGRDVALFKLNSGKVHLMQPVSSGRVTGLVFEGDGQFTMAVPDKIEVAQLRRFSRHDLPSVDVHFTQLVLRVSDDTIDKLFPGAAKEGFAKNSLAENRHNHWLIDLGRDIDAKVIAALLNAGAVQMTAAMKTPDYDWLTFDYDSTRREEIQLIHYERASEEIWVSLDRAGERDANGGPGQRDVRPATLSHIDVKADLSKSKWNTRRVGETEQAMLNGHYTVGEVITPNAGGVAALAMQLYPTAKNVTAIDDKGQPLTILRDNIGARAAAIENDVSDVTMTVIFPAPLKANASRVVTFQYDLETPNYAPGNIWYPTIPDAFDATTARLELKVGKRNEVRSMGRRESETTAPDGTKTSVWIVEKPAKMVTFSTAERFIEVPLEVPGAPKVISFGTVTGLDPATRIRNAGADVINSLRFYQIIFDDKLDTPQIYATAIAAGHGQAFDGFLHLSEFSYEEHPGATELFRTHEVAHEWWGHKVGWKTYRDQWLSESLAEYSAMMFVQATVKGGDKYYDEIVSVYDSIVQGNLSGGFSKFNRPWLVELNSKARARIGPIGVGYRAGTADVPAGYEIQAYYKGPLVLHMLRTLLRLKTGHDDVFFKILRDFVKEYGGKAASTADFQKMVEKVAPGDWSFFFNAWIYDSAIPTLRWSYKVEPNGTGGAKLSVTVKRSGVPDDFVMVAPVRVELDGNRAGVFFIQIRQNEQTVTQNMPSVPKNVIFAPDHSLLANIRRE
jgi:hypothetical protein